MTDTVLALVLTVVLLVVLAAWVPLLHGAERLTRRYVRYVGRELPEGRKREQRFESEVAG